MITNDGIAGLLRDIRAELQELNKTLKAIHNKDLMPEDLRYIP